MLTLIYREQNIATTHGPQGRELWVPGGSRLFIGSKIYQAGSSAESLYGTNRVSPNTRTAEPWPRAYLRSLNSPAQKVAGDELLPSKIFLESLEAVPSLP